MISVAAPSKSPHPKRYGNDEKGQGKGGKK